MPSLTVFAPCDNVLINKDADSPSLIVLLSGVRMMNPSDDPIPENAAAPMRWFIFCQWLIEDDEVGITYEQRVRFGEGKNTLEQIAEFTAEKGKYHQRVIAGIFGFPLLSQGVHNMFLDLRVKGTQEWRQIQRYPLEISYP